MNEFLIGTGTVIALLFPILDPLGNVFPVETILQHIPDKTERKKIIVRETLFALGILFFFLFCGGPIFDYLKINRSVLQITGGVLLFMIAITMVFPKQISHVATEDFQKPFIVPIAIPFIAGPSAISVVMLMKTQFSYLIIGAGITVSMFIVFIIFILGEPIVKFLGHKGAVAIERLMGLLLVTIAVQMLVAGITETAIDIKHKVEQDNPQMLLQIDSQRVR